jgi:hypothetical protein
VFFTFKHERRTPYGPIFVCLSVAFFLGTRQLTCPEVIVGAVLQQCDPRSLLEHIVPTVGTKGLSEHIVAKYEPRSLLEHIVVTVWTEAIVGSHCSNNGLGYDYCSWYHCCICYFSVVMLTSAPVKNTFVLLVYSKDYTFSILLAIPRRYPKIWWCSGGDSHAVYRMWSDPIWLPHAQL